MRCKLILSFFFLMNTHFSSAQNSFSVNNKPRYSILLNTLDGKVAKGLLIQEEDSSIKIFPGKWSHWSKESTNSITIHYSQIRRIKLKKKNGLLRGLLIGFGIGASPVFFGQGGGYVMIISLPLGVITGAIIGIASEKKFLINGSYSAFYEFKKRIR